MAFNFSDVLKRAWSITWRYKVLWIFGILASCSRTAPQFPRRPGGGRNQNPPVTPANFERLMAQLSNWVTTHPGVAVLIAIAFVALIVILFFLGVFLGTIGRIGLIRGTLEAEAGSQALPFGRLFRESLPFFWRVFGLTFLIGALFFVIYSFLVAFGILTLGIGFLCLVPVFGVLAIAALAVSVVIELANVAIVRENLGLVEGWRRGWDLARLNLGPVIVMALLLFIIMFAVGFVIAIPILIILLPTFAAFLLEQGRNLTPLWIGGLSFLVYLPIAVLLGGILNTYMGAAWALTYLRLIPPPGDTSVMIEAHA